MQGKVKIKVEGRLDSKWQDWFDEMEIIYDGDNTILTGTVSDESHLHGILNRIRDLNLKLISVNPFQGN